MSAICRDENTVQRTFVDIDTSENKFSLLKENFIFNSVKYLKSCLLLHFLL